jgi:integrase
MDDSSRVSPRKRLAAKLHVLTARQVLTAKDGDHGDGGGLMLRVRGEAASWVLRYTSTTGKRRELGPGSAERGSTEQAGRSLTTARDLAHKAREQLRHGVDPIDARDRQREADKAAEAQRKVTRTRERWTLARAARDYHERVIEPSRTPKHSAQWIASLENHVPRELWHAPVDAVDPPALLAALQAITPHERARNVTEDVDLAETVTRLRQRLDAVFEDAVFHQRCATNPAAAIKRKLREGQARRERGAFAALPYREAPALMARLRDADGLAARCLELAVLTAARTAEVLGAEWSEFDLEAGVWTVPAERMKGREVHAVFLPPRAVELLKAMPRAHDRWLFPSPREGKNQPLSNMAMLAVLDRLGVRQRTTVHGLARASFSTWANETGAARPDVIEACLAHDESDRVRAAYNRAEFSDERRALLAAWADFLTRAPARVVPLRAA